MTTGERILWLAAGERAARGSAAMSSGPPPPAEETPARARRSEGLQTGRGARSTRRRSPRVQPAAAEEQAPGAAPKRPPALRGPPAVMQAALPPAAALDEGRPAAAAEPTEPAGGAAGPPVFGEACPTAHFPSLQEHIEATMLRHGWIRMSSRSDARFQYWLNINTHETMPIGYVAEDGTRAASRTPTPRP